MGGNESKQENHVKIENNTFVTNRTDINMLNETTQNVSNNVIVNVTNSHTTNVKATNRLRIKNSSITVKGDIVIDQTNNLSVQITTEFINEVITRLQTDLTAAMTSAIENNVSNDILSKLMNNLEENMKKGWGNISDSLSVKNKSEQSDTTEILNNINITNDTHTDLKNIINLVIDSKINNDISNQCMATALAENGIDIENSDLLTSDGNFRLNQLNTLNFVSSCTANSKVIAEISDKLAQIFDVKIIEDKTNKTSTDTTSDIKKTKEDQGVGGAIEEGAQGIGEGASNIINSAGEAGSKVIKSATEGVSSIFSGMTWIFIIIGVVLVAAIIGIIIFLNSDAGQSITQKVADKGLSRIGGAYYNLNNTFLSKLINGGK